MKTLKGGEYMSRRAIGFLSILLILSFLTSGCYYFSANKEMKNASGLVTQLKGMEGAKQVPYEYTSAEKFLEISKMEYGENDFKAAKDFAGRSKTAAQNGLSQAKK